MNHQCKKCAHVWPVTTEREICPRCYSRARGRFARGRGLGTSHDLAEQSCLERGAISNVRSDKKDS